MKCHSAALKQSNTGKEGVRVPEMDGTQNEKLETSCRGSKNTHLQQKVKETSAQELKKDHVLHNPKAILTCKQIDMKHKQKIESNQIE